MSDISKSRKELSFEETVEYTKHNKTKLTTILLDLLAEGYIKAYWSDDHNEVVWQRNKGVQSK